VNGMAHGAQGMEKRPEIVNRKSQIVNRKSDPPLPHRRTGNEPSSPGFTSIELIMVIMCLAILTFAIGVRYNRNEMGSAVAADQLIADIRYVQLKAISIGQSYKITFAGNLYTMSRTDNIESETKKLPNDETISTDFGNTLIFNTLGEPYNASSVFLTPYGQIQLSGGNLVRVYDITGKAE
jgi:type II secretory pathway pseudopilin PulG